MPAAKKTLLITRKTTPIKGEGDATKNTESIKWANNQIFALHK